MYFIAPKGRLQGMASAKSRERFLGMIGLSPPILSSIHGIYRRGAGNRSRLGKELQNITLIDFLNCRFLSNGGSSINRAMISFHNYPGNGVFDRALSIECHRGVISVAGCNLSD